MKRITDTFTHMVDPPPAEGQKRVDRRSIESAIAAATDAKEFDAAAKLQALLPEQVEVTSNKVTIVYEDRDRIVVAQGGGWIGGTVIMTDGGNYVVEIDGEPGTTRTIPPSRIVQQQMTDGEGKVEYVQPVREGWLKLPAVGSALKVGDYLRCCPNCHNTLSPDEEANGRCGGCSQLLKAIYVVTMEAAKGG